MTILSVKQPSYVLGMIVAMSSIWAMSRICCNFSAKSNCVFAIYREGMPKVLLRPPPQVVVVTTDVTGCEAIWPGITGELVPVRDVEKLSEALLSLIGSKTKRSLYGVAGQALAAEQFSLDMVVTKTMAIYEELLTDG